MTTYHITRWSSEEIPKILETREIEASNAGEACVQLGWKLFECSFRLVSDDYHRWNAAKERIRIACQRAPIIAEVFGSRPGFDEIMCRAYAMDDIEIIEEIALRTERIADEKEKWGAEVLNLNIEEFLTDTSLLIAFALWRDVLDRCHYCGQLGETVEWRTPRGWSFHHDEPHVRVCLTSPSCWQRALDDGFIVISEARRPYVEALFKQGRTRRQMQEILRVSRATIDKDIRILGAKGRL